MKRFIWSCLLIGLSFSCKENESSQTSLSERGHKSIGHKDADENLKADFEEAKKNPDILKLTMDPVDVKKLLPKVSLDKDDVKVNGLAQENVSLSIKLSDDQKDSDASPDYAEYWLCTETQCVCQSGADMCARGANPQADNINRSTSFFEQLHFPATTQGTLSGEVRLCVDPARAKSPQEVCGSWVSVSPILLKANTDSIMLTLRQNIQLLKKDLAAYGYELKPIAEEFLAKLKGQETLSEAEKRLKPIAENMVNNPSKAAQATTQGNQVETNIRKAREAQLSAQRLSASSQPSLGLTDADPNMMIAGATFAVVGAISFMFTMEREENILAQLKDPKEINDFLRQSEIYDVEAAAAKDFEPAKKYFYERGKGFSSEALENEIEWINRYGGGASNKDLNMLVNVKENITKVRVGNQSVPITTAKTDSSLPNKSKSFLSVQTGFEPVTVKESWAFKHGGKIIKAAILAVGLAML